ncbi:H+transporting two-sector ATPase B/B' subunit [Methylobacterium sp. 4-46]|uniref:ATP synthase subunit b 2 n=1 Tax=Methylobacterium sp. (strain 4-46) TaxID=426117 RepID=ATPF2_METS4|nr:MULTISPECIES: F0F1 ATP synthase subunit B [Methylobacterium]B0ULY3.1 RecName: Full=ATP synthase subunit b 2; AltName: Full=ATP synthase F(0) sector subunit b 2; AltName: Full=ATPase subunit I 2; AltName: Full=F-type ATPase subunit b 2; Short=F-ATPase subunit b 2 [Methylobacterium sp. 4-46]ACA21180.1 H+transporting two-sector ATPase B/B' subunit [Methylobacterium sp. 4-46]WFT80326.1 F0F1 ATP synthase subunit B [Methylobacterium nodulans]
MAQPTPHAGLQEGLIHEPASEHGGGFPPFQSTTFAAQILWLAIAFGLLYYLMSRVAVPRIAGLLHDRQARLAADLDEASRMKTGADSARGAYERSLKEAQDKAKGIAQATRDSLAAEAETRRKALEADLAAKLAESEAQIRARTATAMGSVREVAADAATAIVERLIGQSPDRAAVEAAYDRTQTVH